MPNAKQANPEFIVTLGSGEKKRLVLSLSGVLRAEEKHGIDLFKDVNWKEPGIRDVTIILWVALLEDSPDLTLEDVKRMFSLSDVFRVSANLMELVEELVSRALPAQDTAPVKKKANPIKKKARA